MGSEDLFWKRKRDTKNKRKIGKKGVPNQTFLIVCEGKCTEPNYFRSFRISSATIEGLGCNTLSLVQRTIEIIKIAKGQSRYYDQVWCVFDRDTHSSQNFNKAFRLAEKHHIKIAYSNEAFELWYLLHFNYYDSAISRKDYIKKLNKLLTRKYHKNSKTIYEEILDKQRDAITNAKRLLSSYYHELNPEKANPSTTVHILVEELNKYT